MQKTPPLLLAILDGLALNPDSNGNAFYHARTPILDGILCNFPHTSLVTCGTRVGLPEGQMGNSEVGHLNIGAGRVVEQELTKIDRVLAEDGNSSIPRFTSFVQELIKRKSTLHLIGLVSKGGVHGSLNQIVSLIRKAAVEGMQNISVHLISDGRDRPPREAKIEVQEFLDKIEDVKIAHKVTRISISTLIGRYYAMDRDKRYERTQMAYDLFTNGIGQNYDNVIEALSANYQNDITDEFMPACTLGAPLLIDDNDGILFTNFRADRMKQLVPAFSSSKFSGFERQKIVENLHLMTLTEYDPGFEVEVLFTPDKITHTLGEVISDQGLKQLRIAETEKYPHVTYFFNGGEEKKLEGEERIMVQSPKDVATYDLKPEMSAHELTGKLLNRLDSSPPDVTILNFANCDMVGHTGVFDAAVKAIETVDTCLGQLLDRYKELKGIVLVTADHGNADQMIDYVTGGAHTYHTLYPVPLVLLDFASDKKHSLRDGGALCDIAPTILDLLGIEKPIEMTGNTLIK